MSNLTNAETAPVETKKSAGMFHAIYDLLTLTGSLITTRDVVYLTAIALIMFTY